MESKDLIIKESIEGGEKVRKKSKFLTFIFSFLPGLGHMYLGLTKQGIQLMGTFFLAAYLADFIGIGFFTIFLPIIWFYSMFDVLHKVEVNEEVEDTDMPFIKWIENKGVFQIHSKVPGIILVVIGLIIIFQKILIPVIVRYVGYEFMEYSKMILVSFLCIFAGMKLLAGTKENIEVQKGDVEVETE